jgi:hypothetical protein
MMADINELRAGATVRDRKWGGRWVGTVTRVVDGRVFVAWDDSFTQDELDPADVDVCPRRPTPAGGATAACSSCDQTAQARCMRSVASRLTRRSRSDRCPMLMSDALGPATSRGPDHQEYLMAVHPQ